MHATGFTADVCAFVEIQHSLYSDNMQALCCISHEWPVICTFFCAWTPNFY